MYAGMCMATVYNRWYVLVCVVYYNNRLGKCLKGLESALLASIIGYNQRIGLLKKQEKLHCNQAVYNQLDNTVPRQTKTS